ncbi:MAG: exonuclease SbcCD subunit D [Magnetococcales bacterium]|nr:exonuclease SbcCD subunit D [Magnetococcales bacterium]
MKIIHTADWHLGHELHGFNRYVEQKSFLQWLTNTLITQKADVLIVAGDLFDTVNPPATAQKLLYEFINNNHKQIPHLQTVFIGGNHDSANRLEAPTPLLQQFLVHTVGRLPTNADNTLDYEEILIPLKNRDGDEKAILAAVPYLRPSDLPPPSTIDGDPFINGIRAVYDKIIKTAQQRLKKNCGLILTGHCYMQGGDISSLSERRILGGGEHALPVDLFSNSVDYVALGHLHKGQMVGGRQEVRYSGSPYPLSVTERDYHHAVRVVTLDNSGHIAQQEPIAVPRVVDYLRVPNRGALSLEDAITALENLALPEDDPGLDFRPFLELVIQLTGPEPGLRSQIDKALESKAVRLAGIQALTMGQENSLGDITQAQSLDAIKPETVFNKLFEEKYQQKPEPELTKAFDEIMQNIFDHSGGAE